jgi:hypothetical protein
MTIAAEKHSWSGLYSKGEYSNLDRHTEYCDWYISGIVSDIASKCQNNSLKVDTTNSFRILSNSLFIIIQSLEAK